MVIVNYGSTQAELYTIARLGWNSCRQHLTDFADFKARYNETYIDNQLAAVNAAELLPDFQARNEPAEIIRIQLVEQVRLILDLWQRLKRYVADAFPRNQQKAKLEAAGSSYYNKASRNNWDSVQALLVNASSFITNNLTALTLNENMPPSFQTTFETAKSDFMLGHQAFLDNEEASRIGRQNKVEANNAVYTVLINMFLDGQEIFKRNSAVKAQFIFDRVLQLVSGSGNQGIKGRVAAAATDSPLTDVTVTVLQNSRTTTTNADGRYEMLQIANGTYTLRFEKEGYVTLTQENQAVQVGVVATLNVQMEV